MDNLQSPEVSDKDRLPETSTATQGQAEPSDTQPPEDSGKPSRWWEALGFKSEEDAVSSYGNLRRAYTQATQRLSELEKQLAEKEEDSLNDIDYEALLEGDKQNNKPPFDAAEIQRIADASVNLRLARQAVSDLLRDRPDIEQDAVKAAMLQGIVQAKVNKALAVSGNVPDPASTLRDAVAELDAKLGAPAGSEEASSIKSAYRANVGGAGVKKSSGKKIFKRSELEELRRNNPKEYARMNDEILLAYAEGRVV